MSSGALEDRRRRRHRETVDEVVQHALAVMAESGAAGLSLGEVARRMHMRTPSLYGYFPSKAALYDEVFARGWRSFGAALQVYDGPLPERTTLHDHLAGAMRRCLSWAATHPAYAQLMFWRPVPRWEPTPESYAPAVALSSVTTRVFEGLRKEGHLRADAEVAEVVDVWMLMVTGLISQHLSNEPAVPLRSSRVAALVDPLVSAFTSQYQSSQYQPSQHESRPTS